MTAQHRVRPKLRFIPFRKRDIVEMCIASGGLSASEQIEFRNFCHVLQSVYHFEFHQQLEMLKDSYAPLNPDRDTRKIGSFLDKDASPFMEQLTRLLNKANYELLSKEDLDVALHEASLFNLQLHIDFDVFSEVLLYTRGESVHRGEVKGLFGLRKKTVEFSNFDRVVIYIKFKDGPIPHHPREKPGSTMLKIFQNVPRADVEMLFPNTRLGMRFIDKLMIGVPALIGGGAVLTTKIGASLLLLGGLLGFWMGLSNDPVELDRPTILALAAGIGGMGSYLWKQFINFKNRKLTYMQSLTESLYFKNLDNNAGVFHKLIDEAEEEECKEAIIAYYFMLTQPQLSNENDLDAAVEKWFLERWQSEVDFEVDDAVDKLKSLGLVIEKLVAGDEAEYSVISMKDACEKLDERWDAYFDFNSLMKDEEDYDN